MIRRWSVNAILVAAIVLGSSLAADACGSNTRGLILSVAAGMEPPAYKCGSEFNSMLVHVHQGDWKGALADYKAHLAGMGKPDAGTPDAEDALKYLTERAAAQ